MAKRAVHSFKTGLFCACYSLVLPHLAHGASYHDREAVKAEATIDRKAEENEVLKLFKNLATGKDLVGVEEDSGKPCYVRFNLIEAKIPAPAGEAKQIGYTYDVVVSRSPVSTLDIQKRKYNPEDDQLFVRVYAHDKKAGRPETFSLKNIKIVDPMYGRKFNRQSVLKMEVKNDARLVIAAYTHAQIDGSSWFNVRSPIPKSAIICTLKNY